jgi:hypothetical protein
MKCSQKMKRVFHARCALPFRSCQGLQTVAATVTTKSGDDEMTMTKRGQTVSIVAFLAAMIGLMAIVGAVETQDWPGCKDYEAAQDWEAAWKNGCPFQDESGNYLYTWQPSE